MHRHNWQGYLGGGDWNHTWSFEQILPLRSRFKGLTKGELLVVKPCVNGFIYNIHCKSFIAFMDYFVDTSHFKLGIQVRISLTSEIIKSLLIREYIYALEWVESIQNLVGYGFYWIYTGELN